MLATRCEGALEYFRQLSYSRRCDAMHYSSFLFPSSLIVWRPRYAGWGWPGGLSLKSNNPNRSGGEKTEISRTPAEFLKGGRRHELNPACSRGACGNRFMGPRPPPMKRIPHAPREHAGFNSWRLPPLRNSAEVLEISVFFFPDFSVFFCFFQFFLGGRAYELIPTCSRGACGLRFMGGGRGPMKQFPHARGEHAGFAS